MVITSWNFDSSFKTNQHVASSGVAESDQGDRCSLRMSYPVLPIKSWVLKYAQIQRLYIDLDARTNCYLSIQSGDKIARNVHDTTIQSLRWSPESKVKW